MGLANVTKFHVQEGMSLSGWFWVSPLSISTALTTYMQDGKAPEIWNIAKKNWTNKFWILYIYRHVVLFVHSFERYKDPCITRQGQRFSIRMVIGIFCSDTVTVFVELNQYSLILRRQCCLIINTKHHAVLIKVRTWVLWILLLPVIEGYDGGEKLNKWMQI